ncbi:hypothetical protein L228DRAFT_245601 [Xylona heveae TC161]|uniref:Thioesterase family protein n=1 Tax=Xylona heveae (strain CBS 132557 / TC161) TaxID=1328760 RepID=A0A165IAH0_XYLHT|nr:hypothetical protein L228DRAFT_245601 [Xylona heveae TC161]KZF24623.1 hypothetical protein L228DRAFT_245601 [Xylona heveae TC161]
MSSFREATAVTPVDSHTYAAQLYNEWCIGSVPHGGFVTALFLNVAQAHFHGTLASQNQPHTITFHLEFLRRTHVGPARFTVKDVKLGSRTSTIHITMAQDDREEVVAYATNSNFALETGPSLPTHWALHPAPDRVDLSKLRAGQDANWEELRDLPYAEFRKALTQIRMFLPRWGQKMKSLSDEWICFRNGEKFTNASVGYVCDAWPQVIESYRARETETKQANDQAKGILPSLSSGTDPDELLSPSRRLWYPTVLLNLDIKKPLPEEGVEWLFARVQAKQIQNGRYDVEIVILDETGDIVALSHHVCLILGAERNMAARKKNTNRETKL